MNGQDSRYKYVKTLVFQSNNSVVVPLSTLTTQSHYMEIPGIMEGRFYLLGIYWNPLVYDYLVTVKKIFNYNDPYLGGEASIKAASGRTIGDSFDMTIPVGSWNRNYLFIKPGIHYIFDPILYPDTKIWFETHITIDASYMLLGQIETFDRFIITLGVG